MNNQKRSAPTELLPGVYPRNLRKIFLIGAAVLLIISCLGFYFISRYYADGNNASQAAERETQLLIKRVSRFMSLPNEKPQIMTIDDSQDMNNPKIPANSQRGDKLLIYKQAQLTILYRPAEDKIISSISLATPKPVSESSTSSNLAQGTALPQTLGISSSSASPSAKPKVVRVAILNGTKINGLAKKTRDLLLKDNPQLQITTSNAKKTDYTQTVVVNLSGVEQGLIDKVVTSVSGQLSDTPTGEIAPKNSNILIILGP